MFRYDVDAAIIAWPLWRQIKIRGLPLSFIFGSTTALKDHLLYLHSTHPLSCRVVAWGPR